MTTSINRVVIGAPFGNWFARPGCTSTLGTFTVANRGGTLYRAWRMLATLRPLWRNGGWTNRLGLPNPGIGWLEWAVAKDGLDVSDKIVSVHGFNRSEWQSLVLRAAALGPRAVEYNVSCPNVAHRPDPSEAVYVADFHQRTAPGVTAVFKLPPMRWMDYVRPLRAAGASHFHLCNTLPTPGGGISGAPLKPLSLWAVREVKDAYGPDVWVLGGGGVYAVTDARDYFAAGADAVAVASALLNPLRWGLLDQLVKEPT